MKVVNLTPHALTVVPCVRATKLVLPKAEVPARLREEHQEWGTCKTRETEFPLLKIKYTLDPDTLPPPQKGTIFVVSMLVAAHAEDRDDLYYPADLVRDDEGQIIGCSALAKVDRGNKLRKRR